MTAEQYVERYGYARYFELIEQPLQQLFIREYLKKADPKEIGELSIEAFESRNVNEDKSYV